MIQQLVCLLYDVSAATREGVACTEQFFKGKREKKGRIRHAVRAKGRYARAGYTPAPVPSHEALRSPTKAGPPPLEIPRTAARRRGRSGPSERRREEKRVGGMRVTFGEEERRLKGKFERQTEQTRKKEGWEKRRELQLESHTRRTEEGMRRCRKKKKGGETDEGKEEKSSRVDQCRVQ
jgi:hypothetical protein